LVFINEVAVSSYTNIRRYSEAVRLKV